MSPVVIWWPSLCGNDTIYDAFWNDSITIFTNNPELTTCFQKTALLWLPCVWLWVCALPYFSYLLKQPTINGPCSTSKIHFLKTLFSTLTVIVTLFEFVATLVHRGAPVLPVDYAETALKAATMMLAGMFTQLAFRKGQHTSGVLFIFWLALSLTSGLQAYSLAATKKRLGGVRDMYRFVSFYVYFSLVLLLFVLSIPSDIRAFGPSASLSDEDERQPLLQKDGGKRKGKKKKPNPCPRDSSNFLSHAFLSWYWGLVVHGYKRTLSYVDMWDVRDEDAAKNVHRRIAVEWEKEVKKAGIGQKVSLTWALTRAFHWKIVLSTLLLIVSTTLSLINPNIMSAVIAFVQSGSPYTWHGYVLSVLLFALSSLSCVFMQQCYTLPCHVGLHLKSAVITTVYRKALRLSNSARKTATTGEIVNLMSVDADRLSDAMVFLPFLWVTPFTVAATMYLIYQRLGVASFVGLAYLMITIPTNAFLLGRFTSRYQKIQMKYKDMRLKLMNQILTGIKVLKLYAWEPYFQKKILEIRDDELNIVKKTSTVITISYIVAFSSNFIVALLCFLTYTLISPSNVLTADKAFVSISLFGVLNTPMMYGPTAMMWLMQGLVSVGRLQRFLLLPEIKSGNVQNDYSKEGAVRIENGTFSWGEEDRIPLKNINLVVPQRKLVAVVGTVGSGKSSLIQAMLGEMDKLSGSVNVKGRIAYVPQQAWIQNLTLRDNILFDKAYNKMKYDEVVRVSTLEPDLRILPGHDKTEIGERGINLSGGQKQRVSLARAIYQDADIYLLDDPLSAVDSHVGKYIFDKVIGPDGILAYKTRVLVTNSVTFLPKVDLVVVLKDGRISEIGSYEELMATSGAFSEFVTQFLSTQDEENGEDYQENEGGVEMSEEELERSIEQSLTSSAEISYRQSTKSQSKKVLVEEEATQDGQVQLAVIKAYVQAGTTTYLILMIIGFLINIAGNVSTNIWLSFWSNDAILSETNNVTVSVYLRLGVYGGLGAVQTLGAFMLIFAIAFGCVEASRTLHKKLLENNLKSPMSFFDTTPVGRILNRYAKDLDVIDMNLRMYIQNLVSNVSIILATLVIIIYSTPIFTVIVLPLFIIFAFLQRVYVKTGRQVKRIDSVQRSPIYANFSETLNGVSSIRAYRQEERFVGHADTLLDNSVTVAYSVFISSRWIGIWLEMLGDLVVLFASIFCVIQRDSLDPGTVGLSLSFSLQVSWQIVLLIRYTCELESNIVAVERLKEYTDTPPEAPWELDHKPPWNWPTAGAIEFRDYQTRYRPGLDLVLRGLDCHINAGQMVGIVGRTGAGKSSMTLSLFRIIEAAGGSIVIDGENISELGLHDLRSKLTIIPQDPVLFSGTVRFNIDPSGDHSDHEVWSAITQAHLKHFVTSLPGTLTYECGEDGENFSVGQRQLLCLARALLRKTQILVMDEATAAVDLETDELIQGTIRTEFRGSTILTIAHRLNTVLDYDRVMVLDAGIIKEFDTPKNLLDDPSSMFYSMASDANLL